MQRPPLPIRTLTALATAALFVLVSAPPTWAGSADDPEISDGHGDVNPASVMIQLDDQGQAGMVPLRAELYDVLAAFVTGEGNDMFHIQIQVADIEDNWILKVSDPSGQPTVTADVNGTQFEFDEDFFNERVNLTANFTINAQTYRVVVSLAEFDVSNPGKAPGVDSAALVAAMIGHARAALEDAKADINALPYTVKGEVQTHVTTAQAKMIEAQEALRGEYEAPTGHEETDAQIHALTQDEFDQAMAAIDRARAELGHANDKVQGANVPLVDSEEEVERAFAIATAKLDDASAVLGTIPAALIKGPGASEKGDASPSVILFHRWTLYAPDGTATPISGVVDQKEDFVRAAVPKALVGAPGHGDLLERFFITSSFQEHVMDFAPDAANPKPDTDPAQLVAGAANGQLVQPTFGRAYAFAYPVPGVGPTPNPLIMAAAGPTTRAVESGDTASYRFILENTGTIHLEGLFSLTSASPGWTHSMEADRFELLPGETVEYRMDVRGFGSGSDSHVSRVTASVEGGGSRQLEFITTLLPIDDGGEDPANPGGKKDSKGTPGFEALALLAAALAVVLVGRRRR